MSPTVNGFIALATLFLALIAVILGARNRRDITAVKDQTNGMLKKLEDSAVIKGRLEERTEYPHGR